MSGLFALLDDIATLAKLTLATVDDTAAMAVKTSAKVSAAAVDDVAATPQYVTGITADRELPVIRRITVGSLRNTLLIILPAGLVATWLAPWLLPVALVVGGSYLCLEAGEKIAEKVGALCGRWRARRRSAQASAANQSSARACQPGSQPAAPSAPASEDTIVARAVRTDFVLSTEIMLLALAEVRASSSLERVAVLVAVALLITFAVYGLVALLIKIDDAGAHLATHAATARGRRVGRGIVRGAPGLFRAIGVVGTIAMCWVGGEILAHNLGVLGAPVLEHLVEAGHSAGRTLGQAVSVSLGGVLGWVGGTGVACLLGAVIGLLLDGAVSGARAAVTALRRGRRVR